MDMKRRRSKKFLEQKGNKVDVARIKIIHLMYTSFLENQGLYLYIEYAISINTRYIYHFVFQVSLTIYY